MYFKGISSKEMQLQGITNKVMSISTQTYHGQITRNTINAIN